jgi:hypothetical protein
LETSQAQFLKDSHFDKFLSFSDLETASIPTIQAQEETVKQYFQFLDRVPVHWTQKDPVGQPLAHLICTAFADEKHRMQKKGLSLSETAPLN